MEILREHRIQGWRRRVMLPGRPDFVFRRERLAVFRGRMLLAWLPPVSRSASKQRKLLGGEEGQKSGARPKGDGRTQKIWVVGVASLGAQP